MYVHSPAVERASPEQNVQKCDILVLGGDGSGCLMACHIQVSGFKGLCLPTTYLLTYSAILGENRRDSRCVFFFPP